MTRVLRSATKKCQSKDDLPSRLSISKNSKIIKKRAKKIVEIKNEVSRQSDIWNINPILSNILAYTDRKDLLEFNTVCKKWNQLSNPIIHKTIKLNRSWDIIKKSHDKRLNKYGKIDADVVECISNNAKHAPFIKEFYYNYSLEPLRAIEVFETFRFISKLTIRSWEMSQDQFLRMISPLTQLQELNLEYLKIKKIVYKRLYKEVVQLPSSLKKLTLNVNLIDNPDLFIQTINSHTNLVEFSSRFSLDFDSLKPFYKPYPSLVKFKYEHLQVQSSQSLIKVFENNPQLISLKMSYGYMNNSLVNYISSHFTNLKELNLSESNSYGHDQTDITIKFSQPTKIKKLNLSWHRLTECSVDSILLNCPHLEELSLDRNIYFQRPDSELFINLSKTVKVKKLTINCENMNGPVFDTLLLNYPRLSELVVILPVEWKVVMKSIYEKCTNLQVLDICPHHRLFNHNRNTFFKEFNESELFTGNFKINSTLTNLTFNRFLAIKSKAEQFKNFKNLNSIQYINQAYNNNYRYGKKNDIDMGLWPGYKLIPIYKHVFLDDIELKKI